MKLGITAFLVLMLAATASADAPTILLAGDDDQLEALADALQVHLAGEGWLVVRAPAPEGATGLERAAAAQQAAQTAGAHATVWVEVGPEGGALVRAVEVASDAPRHAPLPSTLDAVDPRTFAVVAGSLIDELEAPPQRIRVRVQVSVEGEDGTEFIVDGASAEVHAGGESARAELDGQELPPPAVIETPLEEPPVQPDSEVDVEARIPEEPVVAPAPPGPPVDEPPHVWFGADFAPFLGTSIWTRGRETRRFSIGLAGALMGGLEGVGAAGGINIATGDINGALLAGGANIVVGDSTGILASGGFNYAGGSAHGAILSGGVNLVRGPSQGVHAAGGLNWAGGDVRGAQLAGGANLARGQVNGVQAAGGFNFARGGSGAQLGTLNIQRGEFDGVQLGVVNISRDADFALGLINIVTEGRTHLEVTGTSDGLALMTVKHGGEHWHYSYSAGTNALRGAAYALGLGIGARVLPTRRLFLDFDLLSHYLGGVDHDSRVDRDARNYHPFEILSQGRVLLGFKLTSWLALVAGVSLNVQGSYGAERSSPGWALRLDDNRLSEGPRNWTGYLWPSASIGLQVF